MEDRKSSSMKAIRKELARHFVDSTAISSLSLLTKPIIDTQILGIPDSVSIHARLCGIATVYLGLGSLTKLRDISKNYFGLDQPAREKYAKLHDGLLGATLALGLGPAIYYFNGVKDLSTIAHATALGMATTAAISVPYGWYIDTFRDLTGIKPSERTPNKIRESSPGIKKSLAAIATAGFIATAAGAYCLPNHDIRSKIYDFFKHKSAEVTQVQNDRN